MGNTTQGTVQKKFSADRERMFFTLAYPSTRKLYDQAYAGLLNIAGPDRPTAAFNKPVKKGTRVGTVITGSFSFDIAKWLAEYFPGHAEIESSAADAESIRQFFRAILPRTEFENISAGELSLVKRIRLLKGNSPLTGLEWLIRHLDDLPFPSRIKESIFHNLQLYINWEISPAVFSRLLLPPAGNVPFLHKRLIRKPVFQKLVTKKLPQPKPIPAAKRMQLIAGARTTLALLYRETEPFTYADPAEITCFELERGLTIVLYGMDPERRLSIESYIGYLAFKNGVPVAYGGGWIFGSRCQFGINILPAFRGGESTLLFYQLLRVYRQYFNAKRFVVKPYQIGKSNKEALRSGAFWFYYKAGFRPADEILRQLAAGEWKKKKAGKSYRSPVALLKRFTESNLVLDISEKQNPKFDASAISRRISVYINELFAGNREKAISVCLQKTKKQLGCRSFSGWNLHERNAFREWSLLAQAVLDITAWSTEEKNRFIRLVRTKGSSPERDFILLLQQHKRFWKDLSASFS